MLSGGVPIFFRFIRVYFFYTIENCAIFSYFSFFLHIVYGIKLVIMPFIYF